MDLSSDKLGNLFSDLQEQFSQRDILFKSSSETFFGDLIYRFKVYGQAKKQADLFLSSDFNVVAKFILPDEN